MVYVVLSLMLLIFGHLCSVDNAIVCRCGDSVHVVGCWWLC